MIEQGAGPGSVEAIVAEIARLRREQAEVEKERREISAHLEHWLDPAEMFADQQDYELLREQGRAIAQRVFASGWQITEPHPLWPGGWIIECPDEENPDLRWRWPECTPGYPAFRPAWRTRAAAEAALAADPTPGYRVVWTPVSPAAHGELPVPLDLVSWTENARTLVNLVDHFAGTNTGWSLTETQLAVIAIPPDPVRQLTRSYDPLMYDQFALRPVPLPWLHVPLWTISDDSPVPDEGDLDDLAEHLACISAGEVIVGPAHADEHGLHLAITQNTLLRAVADTARQWERAADPLDAPWWLRMSIAYGVGTGPADLAGLHRVYRASWPVTQIAIVTLARDVDHGHYRWTVLRTVDLATP